MGGRGGEEVSLAINYRLIPGSQRLNSCTNDRPPYVIFITKSLYLLQNRYITKSLYLLQKLQNINIAL